MRALNVYTHYIVRILNNWKGLGWPPPSYSRDLMSLDLKRQLIAQLVESSRLLRNYIDGRAKTRGTTRAQWIVLFRLRQQEGLSQVDLADVLELQPISLVRLLDRLVEHGLLERRPDPRDRRANKLYLTKAGRRLVDDLDSLRDAIATDVLRDMSAESIRTSLDTLVGIKERIKSSSENPGDVAAK
jgi:MarR family transcriptional regulator, transcriptional regulator for hemolysin